MCRHGLARDAREVRTRLWAICMSYEMDPLYTPKLGQDYLFHRPLRGSLCEPGIHCRKKERG